MKCSIVIPARNEAPIIADTLQSLQLLRQAGHELILVDGDSEDNTPEIAQPFVDHLIHSPAGRAAQMNAGADIASGEILLFLHVDTKLPSHAIDHLEKSTGNREDFWGRFDVRLSGSNPAFRLIEFMMNLRSRLSGIATGDQAMFVSRSLFKRVGGFPEQSLMEDIEMSLRLKAMLPPVCLAERVITSSRRWEANGITRTVLLMWKLRYLYWRGTDAKTLAQQYYRL